VKVGDGFAGVGAVVDDEAKTAGELELFGDLAGGEEEVSENGLMIGRGVADAGDDDLWDDQQVDRCLGGYVVDDDATVVLVFDLGGDFAVDDSLEKGLRHGDSFYRELRKSGIGKYTEFFGRSECAGDRFRFVS
jgi:hypothetical protein